MGVDEINEIKREIERVVAEAKEYIKFEEGGQYHLKGAGFNSYTVFDSYIEVANEEESLVISFNRYRDCAVIEVWKNKEKIKEFEVSRDEDNEIEQELEDMLHNVMDKLELNAQEKAINYIKQKYKDIKHYYDTDDNYSGLAYEEDENCINVYKVENGEKVECIESVQYCEYFEFNGASAKKVSYIYHFSF